MSLSQSQLRLISSIGVGILVGTSLIVIIPEGIEAAASSPITSHAHKVRSLARRSPWTFGLEERDIVQQITAAMTVREVSNGDDTASSYSESLPIIVPRSPSTSSDKREDEPAKPAPTDSNPDSPKKEDEKHEEKEHVEIPGFEVGFSMILGFILMFLIDRLPKHASDSLQSGPQPQHFSLDNLGGNIVERPSVDEEEGFLGSLTPTPKHTRTLATTIGLVIHAAADGIAMGASSATSNTKLGFIIFFAIMIHKAPAAFGLTSVLLRQGLSKRAARGHLVIFSLAAPVGALSTWLMIKLLGGNNLDSDSGMWWTGMLLLFSGGTFLYVALWMCEFYFSCFVDILTCLSARYVAMHAMQEDSSSHSHESHPPSNGYAEGTQSAQRKPKGPEIRDTLATVAGMLLPLLTQFGHHH